jgi:hypothetical protein
VRTNYRKCGQDYTVFLRENDEIAGDSALTKTYWATMDPNRNDFEDEETAEELIEIGPDKEEHEVDPSVQDLPGNLELSAITAHGQKARMPMRSLALCRVP